MGYTCLRCGNSFTGKDTLKWRVCQPCRTTYYREYMASYAALPRTKAARNDYLRRLRWRAIDVLGGKCVRCGMLDKRVLQIDHKFGGGTRERLVLRGATFWLAIIKGRRDLNDLQILCANCHMLKATE